MMARMSLLERVEVMKELQDTVLKVSCEVQDVMRENFARYNDKDTPLIEEIFTALDSAYEKLKVRCQELDEEDSARYEGYEMYYAWELGLCPYVMREHRQRKTPYAWNSLNWEDIAKYLHSTGMSRADTARAVSEYLAGKDLDGDRVIAVSRESVRV